MPDGRLFVAGGNGPYTGAGDASAAIYDSSSDQWLPLPSMGPLRWYPTVVQLPNNHMLVLSGAVSDLRANMPQVWTGTEWITLTGASRSLRRYPNAYLAPDGQVFIAGSDQRCLYLNTNGAGSWESGPLRIFPSRDYGPTVMIQPGKILYIGGGSPPTATTEAIDLNDAHPKWVNMASMTYPRRQCNATILPDGTVLVNGGTYSSLFDDPTKPVYQAELWNPQTNTWSLMAAQKQYRGYHSTAILMPDGRVFTSGGNGSSNIEVFSPPYLFKGPRPSILSAPATVVGGKPFPVFCSEPNAIAKISLIRLSSTTHTMNLEQRFQWLPFVSDKTGVTVTAPTVSPLTPAGYYLLFVLNGQGVPSVARIVQLTPNSEAAQNPLN